jgi:hypothetical protein
MRNSDATSENLKADVRDEERRTRGGGGGGGWNGVEINTKKKKENKPQTSWGKNPN